MKQFIARPVGLRWFINYEMGSVNAAQIHLEGVMVKDTIVTDKTLCSSDSIVQNLIALRDELLANKHYPDNAKFAMKINSCLYKEYYQEK